MSPPDMLCIGSVHWDLIGRSADPLPVGADVPGVVRRRPGGVACNVAMALARDWRRPAVLASVGLDPEGRALVEACCAAGVDTRFLHRGPSTDRYLAIEAQGRLVAAVADARALERAGEAILAPLRDGRLGRAESPWRGTAVLDGNLPGPVLEQASALPLDDLRLAAASPAKARPLARLMGREGATLYLNRAEAEAICAVSLPDARSAAEALLAAGAVRVLVTDGARAVADGCRLRGILGATPPALRLRRSTGAGDAFLAAHLAAERRGAPREAALAAAIQAATTHVSGDEIP